MYYFVYAAGGCPTSLRPGQWLDLYCGTRFVDMEAIRCRWLPYTYSHRKELFCREQGCCHCFVLRGQPFKFRLFYTGFLASYLSLNFLRDFSTWNSYAPTQA